MKEDDSVLSLMSYASKYKKQLILGPFFKLLEAILELFLPFYMAKLIDQGIRQNDLAYTIKMGIYMLIMSIVGLICVMICQYYSSIASQGFGTELRNEMMKKINQFSHREIDSFGSATLITRATSDINQLQLALAMLIRLVIRAPFLSIGSIIMAFYIDTQMGFIFLITIPVFSLILFFIMKKTVPLYKKVQQKIDHLNLVVSENLSGVRVIRAFSKKEKDVENFGEVSDDLAQAYNNVTNLSALLSPTTILIMNFSIIFILYFGGIRVNTGYLQTGQVLALINYMTQMLLALIVVANLVVIFTRAFASANRVEEVFQTQPEIETTPIENELPWNEETLLSFQHVSFKYTEKSGYALEDINFNLKKNQTLGIIGPTGSGKSTLIQLIPHFYSTNEGTILLNNQSVNSFKTGQLRQHIATVPQKSTLFSGTIRSNLLLGKPDATEEECYEALDMAQCLEFVMSLPDKLDSEVFANGKNFSGGQKQRLSIARALIKRPDLLIMDDSLSALDYQTDLLIRQALKEKMTKTTVIIISQRVSSVKNADNILVLKNGKQVGYDSHERLLGNSRTYRDIVNSQKEREVE